MTEIIPAAKAAQDAAREGNGQFGEQNTRAPEPDTLNVRAELDAVNELYWGNTDRLGEEVQLYLQFGMPAAAHRVEFEDSDQGDYVFVARAFDKGDNPIDIEDDYDRWSNVDEVIRSLGTPEGNMTTFRSLLAEQDGGVWEWKRTDETNEADELAIRERIDKLLNVRTELGQGSQQAAIGVVRRLLPEGARIVMTWGDQGDQGGPDYLDLEEVHLADGTVINADDAFDGDIPDDLDWDDIAQAVTDIRDTSGPDLTEVAGRRDYYELKGA